jgi:hypothetical protein
MSEVKVNKISPRSGTDVTLGDSGDTFTIPSGATLVNNGTATGFFEGISWQSVQTTGFTAVAGEGYPCNTTSAAFTVTLPSSASVGDQVQIVDYAGTFATNNITLTSSLNIEGGALDKLLTTNREGVIITYVDVTQGWVATTGVNSGNQAIDPIQYSVDFLVIAGGASGGSTADDDGGGGGAGGYRTSSGTSGGGGTAESSLTFNSGTVYTVTVGAGGPAVGTSNAGADGSNSLISGTGLTTITSIGGGGGGVNASGAARAGGSGGGAGGYSGSPVELGGAGTANQGYAGGNNFDSTQYGSGGGGGAGAVGANGTTSTNGAGGTGVANSLTGSSITRAGGGGGGSFSSNATGGAGGAGGGGAGGNNGNNGVDGTVNTGGGGGGGANAQTGGAGGSGVVILSMLDADYSGTTTGSPTVATGVSGKTILTFNGSGSYTT